MSTIENKKGGYTALTEEKTSEFFGIPGMGATSNKYTEVNTSHSIVLGNEALKFIRFDCTSLKHISEEENLKTKDESGETNNFRADIDRLCLENAIERFIKSGSRDDAFDVYVCYVEIFKPFGGDYKSIRHLIEMLAEHESNSSSLLMKHRDHYSHSVYVFILGLAIYRNNAKFRDSYNENYKLKENAANHFIENWGLTSLFHDIGYPFEIAHQQMKVYAHVLAGGDKNDINDIKEFGPFVSYKKMNSLTQIKVGDNDVNINDVLAQSIFDKLSSKYEFTLQEITDILTDRPTHDSYKKAEENKKLAPYLYMDHAYFSGVILSREHFKTIDDIKKLDNAKLDAITAITLHNSLFKFGIKGKKDSLSINDGMPLAYLLMLCDELQCWNRISFGQNSRSDIFPFAFDLSFKGNDIICEYIYDEKFTEKAVNSKSYEKLENGKFKSDIQGIIDIECDINVTFKQSIKSRYFVGLSHASQTNYMNVYDFALILNARYDEKLKNLNTESDKATIAKFKEDIIESFSSLSLEFKLSNIAQAKGFAKQLDKIGCFYTSSISNFEQLISFDDDNDDVIKIAKLEHTRWWNEKISMGWKHGTDYADGKERNFKRIHKDMVVFERLGKEDIAKDAEPMKLMLSLLTMYDGLNIYRRTQK